MRRGKRLVHRKKCTRGTDGGFGWAKAVRHGIESGSDSRKAPMFVASLREKSRPDRPADQYRPALDGFYGPDSTVRTDAGDLRVRLKNAIRQQLPPLEPQEQRVTNNSP